RRRPAREDRPRIDGAFARGARPVPRPGRDQLLARAGRPAQGARTAQEDSPPQGGSAPDPVRAPGPAQARVLDPGRGLVAGRPRAVRPRDALGGDAPAPGLLPAGGGDAADRRPRRRPRGPEPPALGAARIHAVARAARGANPWGAARAEARSARVKVWVDISAPAHVLVFRPLIAILRERGDEVGVTTRDYAQTLELLERHAIEAEVIGAHGGRSRVAKAYA